LSHVISAKFEFASNGVYLTPQFAHAPLKICYRIPQIALDSLKAIPQVVHRIDAPLPSSSPRDAPPRNRA
jgi:hypothetical protein